MGDDVAAAPIVADAVRLDALAGARQRDAASGLDHFGALSVDQAAGVHIDGVVLARRGRCRRGLHPPWTRAAVIPTQPLVETSRIAFQGLARETVDGLRGVQIAAVARHPRAWDADGCLRDQRLRQHPQRFDIRVRAEFACNARLRRRVRGRGQQEGQADEVTVSAIRRKHRGWREHGAGAYPRVRKSANGKIPTRSHILGLASIDRWNLLVSRVYWQRLAQGGAGGCFVRTSCTAVAVARADSRGTGAGLVGGVVGCEFSSLLASAVWAAATDRDGCAADHGE